ncbi:hypothetical protein [Actinoplanes teichomyceticus]|uniref:hypothetical protein n=1 Tax=Actinoplanes teichomyceticus TaxID=1867 RepID=UPI001EF2B304|nr:hypothetical protein [Actinoplanes teichomyceticus]
MTPLDDHSQQRRPLFFPVVIATVLLTIIGMLGGYLLGERRNRHPSASSSASVPAWAAPQPGASSAPPLLPTDGDCPPQTQKMGRLNGAYGALGRVLRVTTSRRTVVWICQDGLGNLYYHANKGGADAEWVEYRTALFLTGVRQEPDGSFSATAAWDGTAFSVNRERVLITKPGGEPEEQKVVPD